MLLGWFLLAVPGAAAQTEPLFVDADRVVYDQSTQIVEATGHVRLRYRRIRLSAQHVLVDLRAERITARGEVVLIDRDGRELYGDTLVYEVLLDQAEMTNAITGIDRLYIRSERLVAQRRRLIAEQTMATTCDPARPAYRITATQIEVIPGDRLIARRATIWLGSLRVLTLPVYVMSLRGETGSGFPRLGYSTADGVWIDYQYPYSLGRGRGYVYGRYGTRSGAIARTVLDYPAGPLALQLNVGRNQDAENRLLDQAELTATRSWGPVGYGPFLLYGQVRTGWFRELTSGVQTARHQLLLGLDTQRISLGPRASGRALITWQRANYSTGVRQDVLRISAAAGYLLAPRRVLSITYDQVEVTGGTPFLFDAVPLSDRIKETGILYSQTGVLPRRAVSWEVALGGVYSFRDQSRYATAGIGLLGPDWHWRMGARYGLDTTYLRLTTDVGLAVGYGTYFTIQAIYDVHVREFRDLDFILTSQLCGCIDLSLKYRQIRQEIWFEVGLTGVPAARLQFLAPRP